MDDIATMYVGTMEDHVAIFNSNGECVSSVGPALENALWPTLKEEIESALSIELSNSYATQGEWQVGDVIKLSEWQNYELIEP